MYELVRSSTRKPAKCGISIAGPLVSDRNEPENHIDDVAAQRGESIPRAKVTAEDLREGRPVGDVEKAQRADLPVQFHGIQIFSEHAFLNPAGIDVGDMIDRRRVQFADRL